MTVSEYRVAGREARIVTVAMGDEFLKVEPLSDGFSLAWSCELDVRSAIRRLHGLLPTQNGEAFVATAGGPGGFLSLEEALAAINDAPDQISAVRLEWQSFTLVWQSENRRAGESYALSTGRMALLANEYDEDFCASVVKSTASLAIAMNVRAAFDDLTPVTSTLTPGRLR
jgi:hypothetical protein